MAAQQLDFSLNDSHSEAPKATKKRDGAIRARHMKAVEWFCIDRGLKAKAVNVWPNFEFVARVDESPEIHHIDEITEEYENFKKTTYGRRA